MENKCCTLNKNMLPHSGHWYDRENEFNCALKKPCGAIGDVLTQNVGGVNEKHFMLGGFCTSCPTKFGKSVLQLYDESESITGEKSLSTFFMYLKQLLFNMESDDGDVGGEPTLDERMADVEKAFYHTLRQINPKNDEIVNKILQTIEANADKKKKK